MVPRGCRCSLTRTLPRHYPAPGLDDVACRLTYMDYHKVAEACGAKGLLIEKPEDMAPVLAEAQRLSREGYPVLVNAKMGRTEFRKGSISI